MRFASKLPDVGTTIFSVMSALAAENNALNLSQGFPDYDGPESLREALVKRVMDGHNQYAPMAGVLSLREQIANKLNRYYQVKANPDTEITVVPGATEAIYCAIMASITSGDEVIVFDPCYDSYEPSITLAGGKAIHLPLTAGNFGIDWERVSDAVNSRTRMIIINSPHNPSGSVLLDYDLQQLQQLACKHDLLVLSDEVYEHLVFDGQKHCSVLQYPGLRERSFAVFSFGKTYHITGWKTGYCVAPPQLTSELRKVHQFVCFVGVTPIQMGLADFMAAEPNYAAGLAAFYQAKRDLFCELLQDSRFKLQAAQGTYFQLLDYSDISQLADSELAVKLTEENGIASIPLSVFYQSPPQQHLLRFCFAKNDETLRQAAKILSAI
jgi:methionine aminotransferase